jgi:alpha,alpha-trehalase
LGQGGNARIAGAVGLVLGSLQAMANRPAAPAPTTIPILDYIKRTWNVLTRSNQTLLAAAVDPKGTPLQDGRWPLYISRTEDAERVTRELRAAMSADDFAKIEVRTLPASVALISDHGLLYLPKPYVVPGGRFNEMYGWDSFFISMGLLRDGYVELAQNLVDNFLYEIEQYGTILNANRTYYLTRSQPPFLTEMLLRVYERTQDRKRLESAIPTVEKYYRYWTSEPHLTPETGLSRYFDLGDGAAPEVTASEGDKNGHSEYDLVKQYFRTHRITDYDARQYYDATRDQLTDLFYKGDRAMRESGFDPSNRFGPFNADIIHYNPVCLNSLLYLMETQMAEILENIGRRGDAEDWRARAKERAARINRLMWSADRGMYFDYNFVGGAVREYPFLTTFYPLWAGIASQEQAGRVARNLSLFEREGGLQTSTKHSGDQWDAPYGWAPLQWIAVQGLRKYGFTKEADGIATRFLAMIQSQYARHGAILEKYDVVHCRANIARGILFGYRSNEAGFGWTNAVFTSLYDGLPSPTQRQLMSDSTKSCLP